MPSNQQTERFLWLNYKHCSFLHKICRFRAEASVVNPQGEVSVIYRSRAEKNHCAPFHYICMQNCVILELSLFNDSKFCDYGKKLFSPLIKPLIIFLFLFVSQRLSYIAGNVKTFRVTRWNFPGFSLSGFIVNVPRAFP